MFEMFLDLLRSMHGPNLLRLKGIVKLAETPERPLVIHGVQHVLHPPVRLARWPDEDHRTRLVLIIRDIEPDAVNASCSTPSWVRGAPDRPTRGLARQSAGSVRRASTGDTGLDHPLPPSAECPMLHRKRAVSRVDGARGNAMGLIDRLEADVTFLKGALRALKMTTPIARNPTRVFPP